MAPELYADGGGFLTADGTMTLAFGRGYGGSTIVYTGTSLIAPERVIREWNVPGLDHADIERRSRRYMVENNVHLLPARADQRQQPALRRGLPRRRLPCRAVSAQSPRLQGLEPLQPRLPQRGQAGHQPGAASRRRARGRRGRHPRRGACAWASAGCRSGSHPGRRAARAPTRSGSPATTWLEAGTGRAGRRRDRHLRAPAPLRARRAAAPDRARLHLPPGPHPGGRASRGRSPTTWGIRRVISWTGPRPKGTCWRPACTSRSSRPRT